MATTGGYRNDESCDALKAYFVGIVLQGPPPRFQWLETWERLLDDPWFLREVEICARRAARRYHLEPRAWKDVRQDVLLRFRAKLRSHAHLHARIDGLADDFRAWMGTIVNHTCGEIARCTSELRRRAARGAAGMGTHFARPECQPTEEESLDLSWDTWGAVAKLEGLERDAMTLSIKGKSQAVIAAVLDVSERQVEYALEKAKKHLRKSLAGYAAEQG
jgi:DNA-directed RNA polymerase specialized sigma24 family protein